ncbi:hypothetical protein [Streptomyces sp. NPDC051636]|uniref:hypothetical protein n=1 Tax=Streptomyces sp. NPDC051636 TaxID=3365663 RepID=UPI00379D4327
MWAFVGQILWPVAWVGLLEWYVTSPTWTLWLFFVPMLYAFYRSFLQPAYITGAFRTRRLLREWPWKVFVAPESGIGKIPGGGMGDVWLSFPDPERPEEKVPVILHGHIRSAWWRRRLGRGFTTRKTAQVKEIWFAGDPRAAGVIAVPGPRRLFVIYQRSSHSSDVPTNA